MASRVFRTQVARHDDERVSKVDQPTTCIAEPSFPEHLKQIVEHVGMRLFDLIEQQHTVRTSTYRTWKSTVWVFQSTNQFLGRLRRTDFVHVNSNQTRLVMKQQLGQRLGRFGLANACRPHEKKDTERTIEWLHAIQRTDRESGHHLDSCGLSSNPICQRHAQRRKIGGTFAEGEPKAGALLDKSIQIEA